MPYTPILATLGYVFSPDGRRVLMIHRNARPEDLHRGKYNGLGGKLDAGEDIVAGLCREIREEAGIQCEEVQLRERSPGRDLDVMARTGSGFCSESFGFLGNLSTPTPKGNWNGSKSSGCQPYPSGRAILISCRWFLSEIPRNSTASCLIAMGSRSHGGTRPCPILARG